MFPLHWPVKSRFETKFDPHDLEKKVPMLHLAEDVEFLTMPGLFQRLSKDWFRRAMHRLAGGLPFYRNLIHHLSYEFSSELASTP